MGEKRARKRQREKSVGCYLNYHIDKTGRRKKKTSPAAIKEWKFFSKLR
jgi:hypothetical protein